MKDFALYTVARIAMFVASFVVVYGAWIAVTRTSGTVPVFGCLVIAAVISAVASYFLLQGPRSRFAAQVDARASRMARRFEESRAKEDRD